VVLKYPSIKLRVTYVCVVLIFTVGLVWKLEDYGIDNWILKHIVDMDELFRCMNIKVGSELCDEEYRVITVHPE
jgi:hypothetical protein